MQAKNLELLKKFLVAINCHSVLAYVGPGFAHGSNSLAVCELTADPFDRGCLVTCTPGVAFVDLDLADVLPENCDADTIVKTPTGFHLYWTAQEKTRDGQITLAAIYGGDPAASLPNRQLVVPFCVRKDVQYRLIKLGGVEC